MPILLLIDGNGIIHRAFYALPPFKTKDGIPTNAIFGFFSMLYKAITNFNPTYIAVCFDTPAPTFRKKIFPQYQAQRPKIVDEFKIQIPLIKEGLDKGGIFYLEKNGVEADDLIGTIAKKVGRKMIKVLILSGDQDILQLVDENIFVIVPKTGISAVKLYDTAEVKKKFLLAPSQIVDFKALIGDSSDNYEGAKGIGPKTAIQLLTKFNSLENLFKNLDKIKEKNIREILRKNKENVFLCKKLATILTDVDIKYDLNKSQFKGLKDELKEFLLKYEIVSLAKRLFEKKAEKLKLEQRGLFF